MSVVEAPPHPGETEIPAETDPRKLPMPSALDVEREVLSAIIGMGEPFADIYGVCDAADFFGEKNRLLFQTLTELHESESAIDLVTTIGRLRSTGRIDLIGGTPGIADLLQRSGIPGTLSDYGRIIKDKALRRRLIDHARAMEMAAYSGNSDYAIDIAFTHTRELESDFADFRTPATTWLSTCVKVGMEAHEDDTSEVLILPTGIKDFSEYLPAGGFEGSWLIVGMAPPGVGKTMYALNNFTAEACEAGYRGAYFSVEMRGKRLASRAISGRSRVWEMRFKRRKQAPMSVEDQNAWMDAADKIAGWKLHVDRGRPVAHIDAICRRLHKSSGLDFVVVDYVQRIMNPGLTGPDNIAYTMLKLQELAQDLNIVILALTQPSTDSRRTKKQTDGSDAKGSGSIEEDCDLFFVLEREPGEEGQDAAAGLRIVKGRDVNVKAWPCMPREVKVGKNTSVVPACGWKWSNSALKIVTGRR